MGPVSLDSIAFAKIILHISKYPHTAVNGILLGECDGKRLIIHDCVPLFHGCLTLAPMLEVALAQIEVYCETVNLKICGYYQANEHLNHNDINAIATRIGDKIVDNCGQGCILMVRNDRVKSLSAECLSLYTRNESGWHEGSGVSVEDSASEFVKPYLTVESVVKFSDFDNHLDDVSNDWRNQDFFYSAGANKVK